MAIVTVGLISSCSDDDGDVTPNNTNNNNTNNTNNNNTNDNNNSNDTINDPGLSTLELLVDHRWDLYESWQDGQLIDSTSSYFRFTRNNSFEFENKPR